MSSNRLIVFVKNKLITLDTILPILLEIKVKHNVSSDVVVFDQLAHDAINKNIVIKDILNFVGKEIFITKGEKTTILRRFYILTNLFKLSLKMISGAKIVHFGHLNIWPLKVFAILFNKNVFQMQGNAYDFKHGMFSTVIKKETLLYPVGFNIIIFSKNIEDTGFSHVKNNRKVYYFGETRTRSFWVDYIDSKSNFYFEKYHKDVDISKGVIVFILGTIDALEYKKNLFHDTIEALKLLNPETPILLKPHAYTEVDTVINAISGYNNFHITYLHPSVLCTVSKAFISNNFSNTLADAHSYGIPTIEYSNYDKDKIKKTKGYSVENKFVTYFVNNNKSKFYKIIKSIDSKVYIRGNFKGYDRSDNGLFYALCGNFFKQ